MTDHKWEMVDDEWHDGRTYRYKLVCSRCDLETWSTRSDVEDPPIHDAFTDCDVMVVRSVICD